MSVLPLFKQYKRKSLFLVSQSHVIQSGQRTLLCAPICLLVCLATTALYLCGDTERREGISNCKTDNKLAKMTIMLT